MPGCAQWRSAARSVIALTAGLASAPSCRIRPSSSLHSGYVETTTSAGWAARCACRRPRTSLSTTAGAGVARRAAACRAGSAPRRAAWPSAEPEAGTPPSIVRATGPASASPSTTSAVAPRSRRPAARTWAGTSWPAPIEAVKMETVVMVGDIFAHDGAREPQALGVGLRGRRAGRWRSCARSRRASRSTCASPATARCASRSRSTTSSCRRRAWRRPPRSPRSAPTTSTPAPRTRGASPTATSCAASRGASTSRPTSWRARAASVTSRRVLEWAAGANVAVVPYGGGTSVSGGVQCEVPARFDGVVSLDLGALDRVLQIDDVSRAALDPGRRERAGDREAAARAGSDAALLPAVLRAVDARRLDRDARRRALRHRRDARRRPRRVDAGDHADAARGSRGACPAPAPAYRPTGCCWARRASSASSPSRGCACARARRPTRWRPCASARSPTASRRCERSRSPACGPPTAASSTPRRRA